MLGVLDARWSVLRRPRKMLSCSRLVSHVPNYVPITRVRRIMALLWPYAARAVSPRSRSTSILPASRSVGVNMAYICNPAAVA